ncbi:Fe(3+)-siderophore ABC transporter permease [Paeniglutamicibacter psychrophenolicus]|uniref:Iron complex transport system permease protein n=1 Tax=Paeniglutamicibacter psychrophenolicus TaxID=257454 RepID=A0ABS4WJP4_9MICC|nr:iron complex transport system permease protein [Paeniglutamicibacter psychrophenolicus]
MASPTPAAANPKKAQAVPGSPGPGGGQAGVMAGTGASGSAGNARANMRRTSLLVFFAAVLLLLALLSLAVGSKHIELAVLWQALLDPNDSADHAIIRDSRFPRAVLGILAGSALGIAGALVQSMTRNALAEPGILGVNAGASLAIVIAVGTFGINGFNGYVWFAFGGAVLATGAVYLVGMAGARSSDPVRLVLAGVALGAVLSGIGTALALVHPSAFDQLRAWTIGSLEGRSADVLAPLGIAVLVGFVLAGFTGRSLNALALGDDTALALGYKVGRARVLILLAVTVLAGAATAAVGAISFLGLMAPHLARRFSGPDARWMLAYTAVLAPIILLLADVLGRVVIPGELEAGVVCAFVGAPVLIMLARRKKPVAV